MNCRPTTRTTRLVLVRALSICLLLATIAGCNASDKAYVEIGDPKIEDYNGGLRVQVPKRLSSDSDAVITASDRCQFLGRGSDVQVVSKYSSDSWWIYQISCGQPVTQNVATLAPPVAPPLALLAGSNPALPPSVTETPQPVGRPAATPPASQGSQKRIALVVGNAAYQNVGRLTNPTNDARLVADALRRRGFTIIGGGPQINLNKQQFDQAVRSFGQAIPGADVALFYYAGHGVQLQGNNYLVPTDANPSNQRDVDFMLVDAQLVLRQMESANTRLNLVLLDACRNNPFGTRSLRSTTSGLAQMQAPEGTIISYATQPGNVAQDGDIDSPYTKAIIQAMDEPGLGVFDVFNHVGLLVKNTTGGSQQPWLSASPIQGQFYFTNP